MLKGFREFVMRGNVIDLAVGVIIGAAFGSVVDALVKDIVTPTLGLLGGTPDFSGLKVGPIAVGSFVNAVLAFLIKAGGLYFMIVAPYNRFKAAPPPPPPPGPQEVLLAEIRDLLKAKA